MEEQIKEILQRIEALLAARSTPEDVSQAIEDVFHTYGQISMMREVLLRLIEVIRQHDQDSKDERADLKELMVQLRELARMQVRTQEDLARALGYGEGVRWNGTERRRGDRRKAS